MAEPNDEQDASSSSSASYRWVATPFVLAAVFLVAFDAVGRTYLGRYALQLGSFRLPEPRENILWFCAALFGIPAAICIAIGLVRLAAVVPRVRDLLELLPESDEKAWIAFGALGAFIVPIALRMLVLEDAPVADDESAYEFGAQLVASGHFTSESPPMKLFFDRAFMINDGHLYPMYFMGWPILMAPGVWLGVAGYMNAFYSALTVPAIYIAGRELGGRSVARAAMLLFVTSPMIAIAAATQMSNTTALGALAWTCACWLQCRRSDASTRWHVGLGVAFAIALLVRPSSAVSIGAPILVAWLVDTVRGGADRRVIRLAAVAVPCVFAFVLFLAINKIQNGSYTMLSYMREPQYAKENGLRFTNWSTPVWRASLEAGSPTIQFVDRPFYASVANSAAALVRLGSIGFGWVPSFVFMLFGTKRRGAFVLVASVVLFWLTHLTSRDLGIDTFGTHHWFELVLPLVLLSATGVHALAKWLADRVTLSTESNTPIIRPALFPGALIAGLTIFALTSTTPPRIRALSGIADDVNLAKELLASNSVKRAVVFSPAPFTGQFAECTSGPRHFVLWRPNNDPNLKNPVLWVNHVTVEEDRKAMALFGDRRGYVYFFDDRCVPTFVALDSPDANKIPPGNIDGTQPPPGVRLRAAANR